MTKLVWRGRAIFMGKRKLSELVRDSAQPKLWRVLAGGEKSPRHRIGFAKAKAEWAARFLTEEIPPKPVRGRFRFRSSR